MDGLIERCLDNGKTLFPPFFSFFFGGGCKKGMQSDLGVYICSSLHVQAFYKNMEIRKHFYVMV